MSVNFLNSIRWNLSSKKTANFSTADTIIVTLPKSGNAWLRVFLYAYFSGLEKIEFSVRHEDFTSGRIPKLVFTHDLFEHVTEPGLWHRIRGRHLIPFEERRRRPIVLTVRDPRDVVVSLYFELNKKSVRRKYTGDLAQMIDHPKFGIESIIAIMNAWMREWSSRPNFKLVRYEDCVMRPEGTFRGVLEFLGFRQIDEAVLKRSLEFSSFDNMKRMEEGRLLKLPGLSLADPDDPESFRVRRGVIGGYKDYLNPEQVAIVETAVASLDPRYNYPRRNSAS
jgi:hypothetical protein